MCVLQDGRENMSLTAHRGRIIQNIVGNFDAFENFSEVTFN